MLQTESLFDEISKPFGVAVQENRTYSVSRAFGLEMEINLEKFPVDPSITLTGKNIVQHGSSMNK